MKGRRGWIPDLRSFPVRTRAVRRNNSRRLQLDPTVMHAAFAIRTVYERYKLRSHVNLRKRPAICKEDERLMAQFVNSAFASMLITSSFLRQII